VDITAANAITLKWKNPFMPKELSKDDAPIRILRFSQR
jgi:hypothetical protein